MNKINKNKITYSIIFSFIALAILAFTIVVLPMKALAYNTGYPDPIMPTKEITYNPVPTVSSISPSSGNIGGGAKTVTITGHRFVPGSITRLNGSTRPTTFIDSSRLLIHLYANDMYGASGKHINVWNPAPEGGYSNSVLFTLNGYIAPAPLSNATTNTTKVRSGAIGGSTTEVNTGNGNATYVEPAANNQDYSGLASNAIFGGNTFLPSGLVQWILFAIFILILVILSRKLFGQKDKYHSAPLKHA